MSNDIDASAVSDTLIHLLQASLLSMVVVLAILFVFACYHPILFVFPALGLVGWVGIALISEIAARL